MSERPKGAWLVPVALLALTIGLATGLQAQTPPERERNQSTTERDKMAGMNEKAVTVTGCLQQKPGSNNEFTILGDDGKTYELEGSKNVALVDHVGHKVTVTGERKGRGEKHDKSAEGHRSSTESKASTGSGTTGMSTSEAPRLKVKGVQMISSSCQ